MPTITMDTRVRKNGDVFVGVVDNETVAMNVQNGKYYHLNVTGSRIFSLLDEPRSVRALCAELQREFRADAAALNRDVIDFIEAMAGMGLIIVD